MDKMPGEMQRYIDRLKKKRNRVEIRPNDRFEFKSACQRHALLNSLDAAPLYEVLYGIFSRGQLLLYGRTKTRVLEMYSLSYAIDMSTNTCRK